MLLVHGGKAEADDPGPRTGGVPLVPDGFVWPKCRECGGPMLSFAHLPLETGVIAVFLCQNDPGMCDDWDATAGANRAFVFRSPLSAATAPAGGETLLGAVTALRPHPAGNPERGAGAGTAGWRTRLAPGRGETFTAELEEGADFETSANFGGGGLGYVFQCRPCGEAAFLWQR
ncbi:hypothetical protein [Streptomyces thermolilacinus]|uniref:hypothetical protein n=1 Tax=Streptomyces thermolilacinus TaxID=285540 RepID=UPI0033CEB108